MVVVYFAIRIGKRGKAPGYTLDLLRYSFAWGVGRTSHAQRDETQVSAAAGASAAAISAFSGECRTELFGGGLSVAQGVRDWLTLGVYGRYDTRSDVEISGASLGGIGGDGHVLFIDLQVVTAGAGGRLYADFGPFLRARPFVGASFGLQAIHYGSPALFLGSAAAAEADGSWAFCPLAMGEAGMSYRVHDAFEAAVVLSVMRTSELMRYGLNLEFSWMRG